MLKKHYRKFSTYFSTCEIYGISQLKKVHNIIIFK